MCILHTMNDKRHRQRASPPHRSMCVHRSVRRVSVVDFVVERFIIESVFAARRRKKKLREETQSCKSSIANGFRVSFLLFFFLVIFILSFSFSLSLESENGDKVKWVYARAHMKRSISLDAHHHTKNIPKSLSTELIVDENTVERMRVACVWSDSMSSV